MHPMLNIAVKAARRAGSIIERAAVSGVHSTCVRSGVNDFVTQVDRAAEEAVIDVVHRSYPDHAILAEESGETKGAAADYCWIIDRSTARPISSMDFRSTASRSPCSTPASRARGRLRPVEERALHRIARARRIPQRAPHPRLALPASRRRARRHRFSVPRARPPRSVHEAARPDDGLVRGVRRAGAAALDLAYVAASRLDAFWEMGLSPWDMAAGALLIQEAGGLVGDFSGDAGYLQSGDIAAGTPKVFPQLLQTLQYAQG
jgi:myo-inositol-1(or 4)-monophosphatase